MNKYIIVTILLIACQIFAQSRGAEPIFIASDGSNQPLYSNSYALVVGVSDYTNGWRDLANALNDALEVRAALEAQGFEVQLLENPDKSALEAAIGEFVNLKGTDPQNRLLFYFAGHGHSMELAQGINMGYIIPADAPMPPEPTEDDPVKRANFKQGALDMDAFFNYSRRIESKHVLFIFDSCFSGSMFSTMRGAPSAAVLNAAKEPVRQFITAGDANETVPDVSIFKQQFLRALNGDADTAPKDGYLTGTELGLFLKDRVIHYSQNRQHPQYGKIYDAALDRGDFIFSVSDSTSGSGTDTPAIAISNSQSQPRAEIGQLSGLVLSDINEKPISDAVVTLMSSFGESKYLVRSQTRQDGSFSLAFEWGKVQSLLDDGAKWELTVTRDGYGTFAKPVSFANGQVDPADWAVVLTSDVYAEYFPKLDACASNQTDAITLFMFDLKPVGMDESVVDPFLNGLNYQLDRGIRNHLESYNLLDDTDISVLRCDGLSVSAPNAATSFGKRLNAPGIIWGMLQGGEAALQSVITFTALENDNVTGYSPITYKNDVFELFQPDAKVNPAYLAFSSFVLGNHYLRNGKVQRARDCFLHAKALDAIPAEFKPLLQRRLDELDANNIAGEITPF